MVHINRVEVILNEQFLMHLNTLYQFFAVDFEVLRANLGSHENIIISTNPNTLDNLVDKSFDISSVERDYKIFLYNDLSHIPTPSNKIVLPIEITLNEDANSIANKISKALLDTHEFLINIVNNVLTIFVKTQGDTLNAIDIDSGFLINTIDGDDSENAKYYELYGPVGATEGEGNSFNITGILVSDHFQVIGLNDIGELEEGYLYADNTADIINIGDKVNYVRQDGTIRNWIIVYKESLGNTRTVQYRFKLSSSMIEDM